MKKIVSLLCAAAMTASLWTAPAYAEGANMIFNSDFTAASQNTAHNSEENAVLLSSSSAQTLYEYDNGVKWVTSQKYVGSDGGNNIRSAAWITGDGMYLRDRWHRGSTVNLDFGEKVSFQSLDKITYQVIKKDYPYGDIGGGIRFCVSADENTYYYLGFGSKDQLMKLRQVVNGEETVVATAPDDFESNPWNVVSEISISGNTIQWTLQAQTPGADMKTWTGSYTDTAGIISGGWRYPAAFYSQGDWGMMMQNLELYGNYSVSPSFTEDFSTYETTPSDELDGNVRVLGTNPSGAKWVTSKVDYGNGHGGAYMNKDEQVLVTKGWAWYPTAINLDLGSSVKVKSIDKISYDILNYGGYTSIGSGLRLFVDSAEQNYYYLGSTYSDTSPKLYLCKNGELTAVAAPTTDEIPEGWATWLGTGTIEISGNTISWSMDVRTPSANRTWSGSYQDAEGIISGSWRYPVSYTVYNGYEAYLRNIKIWGEWADPADFSEDFTGYSSEYNSETNAYALNSLTTQTLAEHASGAKWVTSKISCAPYYNGDWQSHAYINGALAVEGFGFYPVAVNLDFGDQVAFEEIRKIKYTQRRAAWSYSHGVGMGLFRSYDESNGFYLGTGDNVASPFLTKKVNGVDTTIANAPEDQDWTGNSTFDVEINVDGNTISWTMKGDKNTWTGSYTDTDGLISANWRYPVSHEMRGDYYTYLDNMNIWFTPKTEEEKVIPKNAYTKDELYSLLNNALYGGKNAELSAVLGLDLTEVNTKEVNANITINPDRIINHVAPNIAGIAAEAGNLDRFYDENKNLKASYQQFAGTVPKLSSVRIGGGSSMEWNFWTSIEHQPSYYVNPPQDYIDSGKTKDSKAQDQEIGLMEWLEVLLKNNQNVSIIPCISPATTSPEDAAKLIQFLTTDASNEYGAMRIQKGIVKPVQVDYVEIGNELDVNYDGRTEWYIQSANAIIDAIKAVSPQTKILINGPTAPWGNSNETGYFLNKTKSTERMDQILTAIGTKIDAIAMHPYYSDGGSMAYPLGFVKEFHDQAVAKTGRDIKFVLTEHSPVWDYTEPGRMKTVEWNDVISTAASFSQLAALDWVDGSYKHSIVGSPYLFGFWSTDYVNFWKTPFVDVYGTLQSYYQGDVLETSVTADGAEVYANAVQNGEKISLILTNKSDYTKLNLGITAPEGYVVSEKTTITAPNMITFSYRPEDQNLISTKTEQISDLNGLAMPGASIMILTFEKPNNAYTMTEDCTVYNTAGMTANKTEQLFATSGKGNQWIISGTNNGYYKSGRPSGYGSVQADENGITLKVKLNQTPLDVSLDTTGYAEKLQNISKISFNVANNDAVANYTVKLFDSYSFNNALAGFGGTGTVHWDVEVNEGTLSWKAISASGTQATGTMSYAGGSYDKLFTVSALGNETLTDGTVTIKDLSVSYENYVITENTDESVRITITPSGFKSAELTAIVGFYGADGRLIGTKSTPVDMTKDADTITANKPEGAASVKVMLWNTLAGMKAQREVWAF